MNRAGPFAGKGLLGRLAARKNRPAVPYVIGCACGQVAEGKRQAHHQVICCKSCGRSVFVLPYSPLPPLGQGPGTAPAPKKFSDLLPWIVLPATAAVLTLTGVVLFYAYLLNSLSQQKTPARVAVRTAHDHEHAARQALGAREFGRACEELDAALNRLARDPATPARESRRLNHFLRQATLLNKRLHPPLDQLLRDWERLTAQDLEKVLEGHKGQAVFFDLDVLRDATGRFQYRRRLGPELPQCELADLTVLRNLPLGNRMQRLIFGARLADLRRGPRQEWIVVLEPDSAVLVTEEEVVGAVSVVDKELGETLERQAAWVLELAGEEAR